LNNVVKVGLVAVLALLSSAAVALAASGWTANPGSSYSDGVVTLVNDGTGTSYENTNLSVPVEDGDTISFEWRSDDVACAGGVPRVFIQGGAYNTFDADPAGPGACGTDADNDGWFTVTGTISGVTAGPAGYTGIVNDNPADEGTIQVRNLIINGVAVLPIANAQGCKNGGYAADGYKNQGQCVSSFSKAK
jgi:hypothetical protein